jgi:hypothetical protein
MKRHNTCNLRQNLLFDKDGRTDGLPRAKVTHLRFDISKFRCSVFETGYKGAGIREGWRIFITSTLRQLLLNK